MPRFINKNARKKYIRPATYSKLNHSVDSSVEKTDVVEQPTEKPVEKKVKENKVQKSEDMTNENLEKVKALVGADVEVPKRRVRKEKKDKGLIERTEGSEILLTEDNKMLLND